MAARTRRNHARGSCRAESQYSARTTFCAAGLHAAHGIEHTTETVLLLAGEGTSYALRGRCVTTKVKD